MSWAGTYRLFSRATGPFIDLILKKRLRAGKEDPARILERKGDASIDRPDGKLIWMHGASVGETSMLLPLISRLLEDDPELHIVVTSGTVTSAEIMAKRLPKRAFHQYVPIDVPSYVERFLGHWRPDLAIWAESEIWPNLILQTKATGAKMALINARLSEKSLGRWRAKAKFAKQIFGSFDLIISAESWTHHTLKRFSDHVVEQIGNLKSAAPAPEFDKTEALKLISAIGDRPVWLAASTHAEEEGHILSAHEILRQKHKDALLIWVPRHPERGAQISDLCTAEDTKRRSMDEIPESNTMIYIMDTLGEMGLALELSDIAFVGGSLDAKLMGHNPLEPARAGVPILTGPYVASFTDIYDRFFEAKAAMRVKSAKYLGKQLTSMLTRQDVAAQMAERARSVAQESDGILDFTVQKLQDLL